MNSEEKILSELKSLRDSLSKIIGTSDLPKREQFSKSAIAKAAKEYQKLSIARGEWVDGYRVNEIIGGGHNVGKFIIQEFGFANYFKRGVKLYFSRKDLKSLAKELKKEKCQLKQVHAPQRGPSEV